MIVQGRALDVLKQMRNASFDCIITSPPYNVGKDYEKRKSLEDYLQDFRLNKSLHATLHLRPPNSHALASSCII
nr:site-specific DNA-methyltransferase [Helicobacter suis]